MMSSSKVLFLCGWTLGTGLLGLSLYKDNQPDKDLRNLGQTETVGAIEIMNGDVQVKPDARIIWRPGFEGQLLSNNDSISTGPNGQAIINIQNSKPLRLGPNSVITIRSRQDQNNNRDVIIDLTRGYLQAEKGTVKNHKSLANHQASEIKIRSGNQTYAIGTNRNTEFALLRNDRDTNAQVLKSQGSVSLKSNNGSIASAIKPIANQSSFASIESQALEKHDRSFEINLEPENSRIQQNPANLMLISPALANDTNVIELKPLMPLKEIKVNEPKEKFTPVLKQPEKLNLKFGLAARVNLGDLSKYIPQVTIPRPDSIGWVYQDANQIANITIPIRVRHPSVDLLSGFSWTPVIGGSKSASLGALSMESAEITWRGSPIYQPQTIIANLSQASAIIQQAPNKSGSLALSIKPGAILQGPEGKKRTVFGKPQTIQLKAITSLGSGPIRVALDSWQTRPNKSQIHWGASGVKPISIILKSASDLPKLFPYMLPGRFQLYRTAFSNNTGIFLVSKKKVIAKVEGPIGGLANLHKLRAILGSNFMYRGRGDDYIGGAEAYAAIKDKYKADKIYVLKSGRFIGINQEFIKKNQAVKEFLKSDKAIFFRAPIQRIGQY